MLTHKGTVSLETSRLLLRRAQEEDAVPMFRNWASDPQVTRFLTWPTYQSVEAAYPVLAMWEESYRSPDFYHWMIVLKELGEPIGAISVVRLDDTTETAEIGYCIGKPWWHQSLTAEALQAVMEYLFLEVGVNRIEAKHDINNPNSGAVMRKCGMQYEGTARASARNNQGICDTAHYGLLRSGWIQK